MLWVGDQLAGPGAVTHQPQPQGFVGRRGDRGVPAHRWTEMGGGTGQRQQPWGPPEGGMEGTRSASPGAAAMRRQDTQTADTQLPNLKLMNAWKEKEIVKKKKKKDT